MNIKSLLLGSAAALVAVSGARAADAIVIAEPEPAEYVRICDVYGAGYFYIPGTETCLRVGGYLRYDASFGDRGSFDGRSDFDVRDGRRRDSWSKQARFALRTWTGQETELGTLKTFTETRFNFTNGDTDVDAHFAWIQLGGLRIGVDESAYDTFSGYAGNVIQDTLIPYGGFGTNLISYTFDAGNGFSALVSLEQGNNDNYSRIDTMAPGNVDPRWLSNYDEDRNVIDSAVPHVVLGAKYTQGWGGIVGVVAYNSNYEEWAGKLRLDVNVNEQLSLWVMGGYGTNKRIDRHFYKPWGGEWAVWGGGTFHVNEKTSVNAQLSYDEDEDFTVAANVAYTIVPGFTITPEINYVNAGKSSWTRVPGHKDDAVGGIIRFQRDF